MLHFTWHTCWDFLHPPPLDPHKYIQTMSLSNYYSSGRVQLCYRLSILLYTACVTATSIELELKPTYAPILVFFVGPWIYWELAKLKFLSCEIEWEMRWKRRLERFEVWLDSPVLALKMETRDQEPTNVSSFSKMRMDPHLAILKKMGTSVLHETAFFQQPEWVWSGLTYRPSRSPADTLVSVLLRL